MTDENETEKQEKANLGTNGSAVATVSRREETTQASMSCSQPSPAPEKRNILHGQYYCLALCCYILGMIFMTDENEKLNEEIRNKSWFEALTKLEKLEIDSKEIVFWFEEQLMNKARQQGMRKVMNKITKPWFVFTPEEWEQLKKEANKG